MPELKPCPFCGCEMRIESNRDWQILKGDHIDCLFDEDHEVTVGADTEGLEWLHDHWNSRVNGKLKCQDGKVSRMYPSNAAVDPDMVLEQAIGNFECLVIIGYDKDEYLDIRCTTNVDRAQINWLIDKGKAFILNLED